MDKIFLHKYKALSGFEVAALIIRVMSDNGYPLTPIQQTALRRGLGDSGIRGNLDMPFQAYSWNKNYPTGRSSLWRLSFIFYPIVFILLLPLVFFHWCISGNFNMPREWKLTKLMMKWNQNIFE